MNWTQNKPTKPGWYLWKRSRNATNQDRWDALYYEKSKEGAEWSCIGTSNYGEPKGGWWLGPIVP